MGLVERVSGMLEMCLYKYCVGVCWGSCVLWSCKGRSANNIAWSVGMRWVRGVWSTPHGRLLWVRLAGAMM